MPNSESTAKVLGYAGLIPFITFSAGCWLPLPMVTDALSVLIAYAAVILSFMGAIHWGIAMPAAGASRDPYLIASVIPALVAWVSLLLPAVPALVLLLFGFITLFLFDRRSVTAQGFPEWYLPMRRDLTLVVSICLIAALLSVVV